MGVSKKMPTETGISVDGVMTWLVEHREILRGYRQGQREAWEAIYAQYHGEVRRFVSLGFSFTSQGRTLRFRGLQSPTDVDDVVQEVFVRAFSEEARLGYDGLHSFRNYLLGIARNVVLRDFRRLMRLVSLGDEEVPVQGELALGRGQPDPERVLIDRQLVQLVRDFEESLSHHDRRFFELRFREQLGQEEVAARMRISRAKVRTCEKRVRRRLQRFLRERQGAPQRASSSVLRGFLHGVLGVLLGVLP